MSELKAHTHIDYSLHDLVNMEFYLKSEADKVIAELEDKLQAANEQIENLINSASSIMLFQDRVKDNNCAELRHHKYKRCLAMARWCKINRILAADYRIPREKWEFYDKWHRRWLELAEKIKEAK